MDPDGAGSRPARAPPRRSGSASAQHERPADARVAGRNATAITMITFRSDEPSSASRASARITAGNACSVSMTTMRRCRACRRRSPRRRPARAPRRARRGPRGTPRRARRACRRSGARAGRGRARRYRGGGPARGPGAGRGCPVCRRVRGDSPGTSATTRSSTTTTSPNAPGRPADHLAQHRERVPSPPSVARVRGASTGTAHQKPCSARMRGSRNR